VCSSDLKEAVDGQIPALGVLPGSPVSVIPGRRSFLILHLFEFGAPPESGHFHNMGAPEKDLHQAEAAADDAAVAEEFANFPGAGVGDDIEILGLFPQEEVPDAASHQVGFVAGMIETVKDFQGFHLHVFAGETVLGAGDD